MIPNRELDHQFIQLSRMHKNCFDKFIFESGLLSVHPWFLKTAADMPGCSQKELSETLRITPASITASIQKAEASGHIRREPDPKDQRRTNVFLTEKGFEALKQVDSTISNISDTFLRGFSEEEKEQLADFFRRMTENLSTINR